MASADVWDDLFGSGPPVAALPPEEGRRAARLAVEAAEVEALRPFAETTGHPIVVPPPPPLPLGGPPPASELVWPEHPPAFFGSVWLAHPHGVGGGRGLVATRALSPGEIVLVEAPLVRWTSPSRLPRDLLGEVLHRSDVAACLGAMRRLHPQDLRDVPNLAALAMQHQPAVHALLPLYCAVARGCGLASAFGEEGRDQGVCGQGGSGEAGGGFDGGGGDGGWGDVCCGRGGGGDGVVRVDAAVCDSAAVASCPSGPAAELLRLCLVCQWNAFDSGLFLYQALINHAAPRNANCDKAWHADGWWAGAGGVVYHAPPTKLESGAASEAGMRSSPGQGSLGSVSPTVTEGGTGAAGVSVVRATRRIAAGEEITISYLQPAEISAARAEAGLLQFDFCEHVPHDPAWDGPSLAHGACSLALAPSAAAAGPTHGFSSSAVAGAGASGVGDGLSAALAAEAAAHARLRTALQAHTGQASLGVAAAAIAAALAAAVAVFGERHLAVACLRRQAAEALRGWLAGMGRKGPRGEERMGEGSGGGGEGSGGGGVGTGRACSTAPLPYSDGSTAALLQLLSCSLELWRTRSTLLGPFHPECALALHDVAASLDRLLAAGPLARAALGHAFPAWGEPRLAALAASRALVMYTAISALYSDGPATPAADSSLVLCS
eukprot:scaffold22678_cov119-Isochrysis_galbana.AAC.3